MVGHPIRPSPTLGQREQQMSLSHMRGMTTMQLSTSVPCHLGAMSTKQPILAQAGQRLHHLDSHWPNLYLPVCMAFLSEMQQQSMSLEAIQPRHCGSQRMAAVIG